MSTGSCGWWADRTPLEKFRGGGKAWARSRALLYQISSGASLRFPSLPFNNDLVSQHSLLSEPPSTRRMSTLVPRYLKTCSRRTTILASTRSAAVVQQPRLCLANTTTSALAPISRRSYSAAKGRLGFACHNCGSLDHSHAQCPRPRKCYSCGSYEHERSACPNPQRCYRCGELGHMMADCPQPRGCHRCGKIGHLVADCPEPRVCLRCGDPGHLVADCPQPRTCLRCGKPGHMVANCPQPKTCNLCGKPGHLQKECPTR